MHINLYVKVGRAAKHCVATVKTEAEADAVRVAKAAELTQSGVDIARVEFTREVVGAKKGVK